MITIPTNDHPEILFKKNLSKAFKTILETKHLYQNFNLNLDSFFDVKPYSELTNLLWEPILHSTPNLVFRTIGNKLEFTLPTIKSFCSICNRIEPYNPFNKADSPTNFVLFSDQSSSPQNTTQLFALLYQCQSCKTLPEVFLIRRENLKLIVSGRSPMERVTTPNFIHKSYNKFYVNAIIAYNSGQTLAGLFFLRVFIEQYTKNTVGNNTTLKADEIIDSYMVKLPQDFKDRFPSLKKIYSDLSEAIHLANDSVELFNQSIEEINKHFDAKRVYKIDFEKEQS